MARAVKTSLEQELSLLRRENKYSPDMSWMTWKYARLPVFIYGTAKVGMSDHALMKKFPMLGSAHTVTETYSMYISKENEAVVFYEPNSSYSKGRVYGEIFIVPPVVVLNLDNFYCQGEHFSRSWIDVVFHDADAKQSYPIKAVTWLGIRPNWAKYLIGKSVHRSVIDSGGRWYNFTPRDDKPNKDIMKEIM